MENSNSNVLSIANYVFTTEKNMSHKKLQKLCFYISSFSLALTHIDLINDDFEAWTHGPVCKKLFEVCKTDVKNILKYKTNTINENDKELIDIVLKIYGSYTGEELEILTTSEEPWNEARCGLEYWEMSNNKIDKSTMEAYYFQKIKAELKKEYVKKRGN